jgi:hypothetical protein
VADPLICLLAVGHSPNRWSRLFQGGTIEGGDGGASFKAAQSKGEMEACFAANVGAREETNWATIFRSNYRPLKNSSITMICNINIMIKSFGGIRI